MKFDIARSDLIGALGRVHRVVERRNTIPILGNILLATDGNLLRLKATDLDIEVTDSVQANVSMAGACTVPAYMLHDIVKKVGDKTAISFDASDGRVLNLKSGRSSFALQTLPDSDFPALAMPDTNIRFVMPSVDLKAMIDATQFAISTEETRYYLNGIFFHVVDGTLRACSTDGHRLAKTQIDAPEGAGGMQPIIIPRKTIAEIARLLGESNGEVEVSVSEGKIRVSVGTFTLTSKLIDGTFPDYERVIPKANDKLLRFNRDTLAEAVDRVATVSVDRGRAIKLSLAANGIKLTVRNPDAGQAEDEIEAEYSDTPLEIGFNSKYLLDILAQCGDGIVHVHLADPGSPALFHAEDNHVIQLVCMPMRV